MLKVFLKCGMNILVTGPVFQNRNQGNSTKASCQKFSGKHWMAWIVQAWHHINFWFLSGGSAGVDMEELKAGNQNCTR